MSPSTYGTLRMSSFSFSHFPIRRVAVALLFAGVSVRAQDSAAPVMTLAQALARAADSNPSLMAHGFQERATDALIEQAGLRPNPTLEMHAENFAGTGALQGVRGLEATVQASQAFERGGKREKRIEVASRERDSTIRDRGVRRAEVLASTASAFVAVLAAQQRVAFANEPLRLAREVVTAAESRVQFGAASPAESARARAALASVQGELVRAQVELNAARIKLAATWGGGLGDVATVAGVVRVPEALPAERVFAAKLGVHPRLALQQAIIAGRRASLELEQAQATQNVTVGGGVRFLREGSDAGFVAGVSWPLPVRNKNQGNIRAARETLAGAELTVRAIEAELQTQLSGAWQEMAGAHAAMQALRHDALPPTEEAHQIVRRAYEQGQLPLIDVLEAQRALITLRRELLEAETNFIAAHARAEGIVDSTFPVTMALLSSP